MERDNNRLHLSIHMTNVDDFESYYVRAQWLSHSGERPYKVDSKAAYRSGYPTLGPGKGEAWKKRSMWPELCKCEDKGRQKGQQAQWVCTISQGGAMMFSYRVPGKKETILPVVKVPGGWCSYSIIREQAWILPLTLYCGHTVTHLQATWCKNESRKCLGGPVQYLWCQIDIIDLLHSWWQALVASVILLPKPRTLIQS